MKLLSLLVFSALLALMPAMAMALAPATDKGAPPVSQTLVREGDYAVKLADALKLGKMDEAKAESTLASLGIAPLSGWISDFPVTPDIVAEVQSAVDKSASTGRLSMDLKKADEAIDKLNADLGLPVKAAKDEKAPEGYKSWQESSQYAGEEEYPATVINNYYTEEGPPVVTYYPPPYDYYYLYAWDPFPFWWGGIWFSGFFCLRDFDRVVVVNKNGTVVVTNHVADPKTKAVTVVDPVTRSLPASMAKKIPGASSSLADRNIESRKLAALKSAAPGGPSRAAMAKAGAGTNLSGTKRFDQTSARSILNRSASRSSAGTRSVSGGSVNSGSRGLSGPSSKTFSGGASRGMGNSRSFSGTGGRSSGSAPSGGGRSFGGAPSGGGHSFGGAPSGGGHSFGGGGFGGGGGCRGRC